MLSELGSELDIEVEFSRFISFTVRLTSILTVILYGGQGLRCWSPGPGRSLEGFPPAVWPTSGKKSCAEALDAMRKGGPVRAKRDVGGDAPERWPRGYVELEVEDKGLKN